MASQDSRIGVPHFFLNLLRIGAGVLFMEHGVQKLFGWLGGMGGHAAELGSKMWLAGMLETWGGLLILLGLFTRPAAFVLAGEMIYAYLTSHLPNSPFPLVNRGEPAVLFSLIFLFFAVNGGGAFSLDGLRALRGRGSPAS